MVELSGVDLDGGRARIGFAGDTMNTAVYLARLGVETSYVTLVGRDPISDRMVAAMAAEGVDVGLIGRHPDRLPGLYAISLDAAGERSFLYWRDQSAARRLFSDGAPGLDCLNGFGAVYLSGITLAILPEEVRGRLVRRLGELRARGTRVIFDSNYRPRLWPDAGAARAAMEEMWRACSLGLPSLEDEAALNPGAGAEEVAARLRGLGVEEVVVKMGGAGLLIETRAGVLRPRLAPAGRVVDSTGAGDSFNAGYIAARLEGREPAQAAEAAHRLALAVLAEPGAIIPREKMPREG
jgi:2-dehydro-3-deoxygluconokinase